MIRNHNRLGSVKYTHRFEGPKNPLKLATLKKNRYMKTYEKKSKCLRCKTRKRQASGDTLPSLEYSTCHHIYLFQTCSMKNYPLNKITLLEKINKHSRFFWGRNMGKINASTKKNTTTRKSCVFFAAPSFLSNNCSTRSRSSGRGTRCLEAKAA